MLIFCSLADSGEVEGGPGRRVIGRALQLARGTVDPGRAAGGGKRCREQDMVDAQAEVLLETEHPVIPPREGFLRLCEEPEAVAQAEFEKAPERGPFGLRAKNLACPDGRVVYVAVVRGD